jgi:hypothetical protein
MPFKKKKLTAKSQQERKKLKLIQEEDSLLEYFTYHDKYYSGLKNEKYMFTNLGFTLSDYIDARLEAQLHDPMGDNIAISAGLNVIEAAARRQNKMRMMAC